MMGPSGWPGGAMGWGGWLAMGVTILVLSGLLVTVTVLLIRSRLSG